MDFLYDSTIPNSDSWERSVPEYGSQRFVSEIFAALLRLIHG